MSTTTALYSDNDLQRAQSAIKSRLTFFFLIVAVALAVLVAALILRYKIPAIALTVLFSWIAYFYLSTKALPWIRYRRFLREMGEGLSRVTEGRFVLVGESSRMVDGVEVYDFVLRVGDEEEDERLFLWDADKPRPEIAEGQLMRIISYSNYVKEYMLGA